MLVGSDFETITCSKCQTVHQRFSDDMSDIFSQKLTEPNEDILMSCCNQTIKVYQLELGDGGAFTQYDLEALEPTGVFGYWDFDDIETQEDYDDEEMEEEPMPYGALLSEKARKGFSEIFGAPVKVFWERA